MDARYGWHFGARLTGARVRQGRARLRRAWQPGFPYAVRDSGREAAAGTSGGVDPGGGNDSPNLHEAAQRASGAAPRARAQLAAVVVAPAHGAYPRGGTGP